MLLKSSSWSVSAGKTALNLKLCSERPVESGSLRVITPGLSGESSIKSMSESELPASGGLKRTKALTPDRPGGPDMA